MQVCLSGNYISTVISSSNYTSSPSMVEILLFDLVFHDRVTPVSISTLKPPLGIIGALPLKSWALLWQPLDQCPIAAQAVNLKGQISSGNTSCVFTRELDRKLQQYSTDYLYKLTLVHAMTVHRSTLMSMPCSHVHYSSTMHLPQGHHAMSMCPNIILFNFHHTCVYHVYTMRNPCPLMSLHL